MRGSILSPAYPENYPNSLNCTWQILAQAKEDVKIVIKEFDLAENDYLTIIDGNHTLAHLTGMRSLTLKRKFRSRTNTLIVVFVSDNSLAGKGFWLKYTRHVAGENALGKLPTLIEQSFFYSIYSSTYQDTIHPSTSSAYQDQPANREL